VHVWAHGRRVSSCQTPFAYMKWTSHVLTPQCHRHWSHTLCQLAENALVCVGATADMSH
jgi:hypothetical protein